MGIVGDCGQYCYCNYRWLGVVVDCGQCRYYNYL